MRNAFAAEITALGKSDPSIVLLSGDIGNKLFDNYKAAQADRFFNCGVAEQNMVGVAAGMALSGLRPVVYTINSFLIGRSFEQIRLDVCYHNLPVVLVGVGGGLGYASLGPTHHSLEDVAILKSLPNLTILCPADPVETRVMLREAVKQKGPVFIRIGKKGEEVMHKEPLSYKWGDAITITEGKDVCLLSTGVVLPLARDVAKKLSEKNITSRVVSVPMIKPLNEALLKSVFANFSAVVSVEEHFRIGGFGASVAEWLADQGPQKATFLRYGTADEFMHEASTLEYAREKLGLSEQKIISDIEKSLRRTS